MLRAVSARSLSGREHRLSNPITPEQKHQETRYLLTRTEAEQVSAGQKTAGRIRTGWQSGWQSQSPRGRESASATRWIRSMMTTTARPTAISVWSAWGNGNAPEEPPGPSSSRLLKNTRIGLFSWPSCVSRPPRQRCARGHAVPTRGPATPAAGDQGHLASRFRNRTKL